MKHDVGRVGGGECYEGAAVHAYFPSVKFVMKR